MTSYAFSGNLATPKSVADSFVDRALLVVVVLAGFSFERLLNYPHQPEGNPLSRLLWTTIYLLVLGGLIAERKTATRLLRGSLPILLILLTAAISTVWSQAPEQTAKESFGLAGTDAIALYFVCRLSLKSFLDTLSIAIVISALISAVLIAFSPDTGRMTAEYNSAWQGSFVDKNYLGGGMVLGIFTVMCGMHQCRGLRRVLRICAVILFLVLLAGSHCMTYVFACGGLALIVPLLFRSRAIGSLRPALVGLSATALVTTCLLFAFGADSILGFFGKDATLTGRTGLWEFALDGVSQQPLLGYGYVTFLNPYTATGNSAMRALGWETDIFTAHNGFLDVTLGTGLLGLAFVIAMMVVGFKRSATLFWQRRDSYTPWPLLAMLYTLLSNFTAASIARVNEVNWIVYLVAFLVAVDAHQRGPRFRADESPRSLKSAEP